MADNYFAHQELIKKNKLLLTKVFPKSLRLFDRTIGLFYRKRANGGIIDYIPIKIGKNGQCDVWAVFTAYLTTDQTKPVHKIPVHVEMEFKTGKGDLTDDQVIWRDFCLTMGWIYILVRENTCIATELRNEIHKKGLYVIE